jgi:hypothetical protein
LRDQAVAQKIRASSDADAVYALLVDTAPASDAA